VVLAPDGVVLLVDAVYGAQLIERAQESVPIPEKAIPVSSISHTSLFFFEAHVSVLNAAGRGRRLQAWNGGLV
jgi:hypothetical protein